MRITGIFYVGRWVQALIFVLLELFGIMTITVGRLRFAMLILFGLSCGSNAGAKHESSTSGWRRGSL
jgi:hypothetical protein